MTTDDLLKGTHITPKKLKVTFRIQKNHENGQSITLAAGNKNHHICPVHAAHQIYLCAKHLGQSDDQPMGVLSTFECSSYDFMMLFGKNRMDLPDIIPVDDAMVS